jgi:hypothetical protein
MRSALSLVWSTVFAAGIVAAVGCREGVGSQAASDAGSPPQPTRVDAAAPPSAAGSEAPPPADKPPVETKPTAASDAAVADETEVAVAALTLVASCDEAAGLLRERAIAIMSAQLDANRKNAPIDWCVNTGANPAGLPSNSPAPAPSGAADGATATSMTNNQIAGVDEADFIKNDTKYIYAAMNGALRIVQAWPAAEAHEVATVQLEGTPKKLFVQGDRALVYVSLSRGQVAQQHDGFAYVGQSECTYGYDCTFGGDGTATAMLVFDISDRAAPVQVRRIDLSGSLLAARRIGNAVHTVAVTPELSFEGLELAIEEDRGCRGGALTQAERDKKYEALRTQNIALIEKVELSNFLPSVTENGVDYAQNNCDALYREIVATGTAFTSVVSVDMAGSSEPVVSTVMSKPGPVYASSEALYMAVLSDDVYRFGIPSDPQSNERKLTSAIHKFRVTDDATATTYLASGKVKGHVLNQFSMDEHAQHLRVATSWGKVPSPDVHSTMSVLAQREDKLDVVGMVDDIAPSEDIRSVRFNGDRGFIVTFKKTDPLYAFDLSKPTEPKITGELKIPGFSTYMHMLDDTHLLTIGYDAADQGDFAYFTGVLLQIFDVSDPADLKLAHKVSIGTRGSSSEALTNHLAFTLFQGKLALPMTICEGGDDNGGYGSMMTFSGLMLFDVSVVDGIAERGRVAHPKLASSAGDANALGYVDTGCSNWWTRASSVVQRSVFMDEFVYSIAQDVMRVQNVTALGTDVASVALGE